MNCRIEFTSAVIQLPPRAYESREIGACVEFQGIVREQENDKPISGLNYEAYEPMARMKLEEILHELSTVHPCAAILLIHRLGFVPVGEMSLFIRVQARHRQPALHLIAELIDRLKTDVPIWKQA